MLLSRLPPPLVSLLTAFILPSLVLANTEIIAFSQFDLSSDALPLIEIDSYAPDFVPQLLSTNVQHFQTLQLDPTHPTHSYYTLDLSPSSSSTQSTFAQKWFEWEREWGLPTGWTVRLCWPASAPTSFSVDLSSLSSASPQTALQITAKHSAVPFPSHAPSYLVPYTLILEPTFLGGIPLTCAPIVGAIVGVLVLLWVTGLPERVCKVIEEIVEQSIAEE